MHFVPKPCDRRAEKRMWLFIALGAVCFCLTPLYRAGQAVFQLGAVILIGCGIFTAVRYLLTEFTYEIVLKNTVTEENAAPAFAAGTPDVRRLPPGMLELVVRKASGRRAAVMDACLPLDELRYFQLLPAEGGREREVYRRFPEMRVFYYTASPVPEKQYIAVFVDSAANATGVVLEPDEAFAELLSRAAAVNTQPDDEGPVDFTIDNHDLQ